MATMAKGTIQGNNNLREHTYMPIIKVSLLLSYIGKDMGHQGKGNNLREHTYMAIKKSLSSKLPWKSHGHQGKGNNPREHTWLLLKVPLLSYLGKDMAIKAKGTTQGNNNLREHTYMPINKSPSSKLPWKRHGHQGKGNNPREQQPKGTHIHAY